MLHTPLCGLAHIEHPIVQAGMAAEYTNPQLVAAVSAAGGLGILGCLGRSPEDARAAIAHIRAHTDRPFGVNFVLHRLKEATFSACLDARVPVFSFFRGDPALPIARAHTVGALAIVQITTLAEADQALQAGADLLVAQGTEAGGHMGPIPLWSLLPAVVARAGSRPVLAAGGIVDGRGLAAALCLGAAGVLLGTRFLATPESPISPAYKRALLAAGPAPDATIATGLFDLIWGWEWPGVQVRALRNALTDRWAGREAEALPALDTIRAAIAQAEAADDPDGIPLLAGEGAARITSLQPAGDLVRQIAAEAAATLREWGQRASA